MQSLPSTWADASHNLWTNKTILILLPYHVSSFRWKLKENTIFCEQVGNNVCNNKIWVWKWRSFINWPSCSVFILCFILFPPGSPSFETRHCSSLSFWIFEQENDREIKNKTNLWENTFGFIYFVIFLLWNFVWCTHCDADCKRDL